MTIAYHDLPASRGVSLDGARAVLNTALLPAKRRIVAARTAREMAAMPDALLDDIGILRARIPEICREMAERNVV